MIRSARQEGFTLIEVLAGLFLLLIGLLGVAPLFVYASQSAAVAGQTGTLNTMAVGKMEDLRQVPFAALTAGGSIDTDTTAYFDAGDPDYLMRWQITDNAAPPTEKIITVRLIANHVVSGEQKEITLTTMRAM